MDLANSTSDEGGDAENTVVLYRRKCLSLEARHSKSIESARQIRSSLSASIFIPKQRVKSKKCIESPPTISPKKQMQQDAKESAFKTTDFDRNQQSFKSTVATNLRRTHLKESKQKSSKKMQPAMLSKFMQYRKILMERRKVIRTKVWKPLPASPKNKENNKNNEKAPEQRSIEDELKSMGLEVTNDTDSLENGLDAIENINTCPATEDIVRSLSLDESIESSPETTTKDNAKYLESPKIIEHKEETQFKKANQFMKNMKEDFETNSKPISHTCERTKEIKETFQSYNDSLHAVREFDDILQTTSIDDNTHRNLVDLHDSINKFSAFLYRTYRNLELMEAQSSKINQTLVSTLPENATKPATEFVVRIDVPNLMEQVITFDTTEILQHTLEHYEQNQQRNRKRKLEKSAMHSKTTAVKIRNQARQQIEQPHPPAAKILRNLRKHQPREIQENQREPLNYNRTNVNSELNLPTYLEAVNSKKQRETVAHVAPRNKTPTKEFYTTSIWPSVTEPEIHPAFRNCNPSSECNTVPVHKNANHMMEYNVTATQQNANQILGTSFENSNNPQFYNHSNNGLQPPIRTLRNSNHREEIERIIVKQNYNHSPRSSSTNTNDLQFSQQNAQIRSPVTTFSAQSKNFSRPIITPPPAQLPLHLPSTAISHSFNIPYPMANQIPPPDSREFLNFSSAHIYNPLLTPPQSTDSQTFSPFYRPLLYYPYPGLNQTAISSITPPSEDAMRPELLHQSPPILLPPTIGINN